MTPVLKGLKTGGAFFHCWFITIFIFNLLPLVIFYLFVAKYLAIFYAVKNIYLIYTKSLWQLICIQCGDIYWGYLELQQWSLINKLLTSHNFILHKEIKKKKLINWLLEHNFFLNGSEEKKSGNRIYCWSTASTGSLLQLQITFSVKT